MVQRLLQRCAGIVLHPVASVTPLHEVACRAYVPQQEEATVLQCPDSSAQGPGLENLATLPCSAAHHTGGQHRQHRWRALDQGWGVPAALNTPTGWHKPTAHPGLPTILAQLNSPVINAHRMQPCPHTQLRGYKSLKKSMKPIYAKASKLAVQPFVDPSSLCQPDARHRARQAAFRSAPIIDTVLPQIPSVPEPEEFRRVGRITGEYTLGLQPVFGVVEIRGTQFKVTADDILFVSHIKDAAVNEVLSLDRVMLVGGLTSTSIGRPYLPNACVLVAVEEHFQDGEVHVYHFKKRNRYSKYNSARQSLTALRVLHVVDDTRNSGAQNAITDHVPVTWYRDADRAKQRQQDEGEEEQAKTATQ